MIFRLLEYMPNSSVLPPENSAYPNGPEAPPVFSATARAETSMLFAPKIFAKVYCTVCLQTTSILFALPL